MAKYQNGMNMVYTPPVREDGTGPVANIVLVHGLFGHPWKTWANESVKGTKKPFWPEDLLPNVTPNARIFSFGYDADIERFMSAVGLNTVHQHGRNLFNDLCDMIDGDESTVPFIFIVHSLGGLVLKEALNQSTAAKSSDKRRVAELTHGIIFLGTPHRGSSVASYGKMAFLLTKIFAGQSANTQLLRALEHNSETLDRINTAFHDTLEKHDGMKLFSFYEEKETRKAMFGVRIVPPECARIGPEDWGGIPENHRYMAKFKSESDPGFVKISRIVKRWSAVIGDALKSSPLPSHIDCLNSLNNPTARARIQQVPQRHKDSFEWLFSDQVGFSRWLKEDSSDAHSNLSPIFWVTGKPGSGKSTLMRFAMQDPRTLALLPGGNGKPVAYFFHLRGKSSVQKSLRGMLLEITYQILAHFPQFYLTISSIYQDMLRTSSNKEVNWDTEALKQCVLRIPDFLISQSLDPLMRNGKRTRIVLFIDALDENEDQADNVEVVSILKQVAEGFSNFSVGKNAPILKICLASRHWPIFQRLLGDEDRILRFAIHDYTKNDIRLYCKSRLSSEISGRATCKKPLHYWIDVTTERAHGVFIWVRIVADYLCRNIIDGTPYSKLQEYFDSLPDELNDLYEYTLARIPQDYALETLVSLRILLASQSTLTLEALYCATIACVFGSYEDNTLMAEEDRISWLRSRTGGLIELAATDATDSEPTVQFIHQTTQEFLLRGVSGLHLAATDEPWLHLNGNFYIYKAIAASHPPYQPLTGLAQNIFAYLNAIDLLFENEASVSAMGAILDTRWSRATLHVPRNGFRRIYQIQGPTGRAPRGGLGLSATALARYYIDPDDREIFHTLVRSIDNLAPPGHIDQVSGGEEASDLSESKDEQSRDPRLGLEYELIGLRTRVILKRHKLNSSASSLALILHDVCHANHFCELDFEQEQALLLVAALGPRFTTQEVNRLRLVRKIYRKSTSSPREALIFDPFTRITNGLNQLRGDLHSMMRDAPFNILWALVHCEEHPHVDEDMRFRILKTILDETPPIPPEAMMATSIVTGATHLLDYCARFKERHWTELLMAHYWRPSSSSFLPTLPVTEHLALKAALGEVDLPVGTIRNDADDDFESGKPTHFWDPTLEIIFRREGEGYLIPGLLAGVVAHPSLHKAALSSGLVGSRGTLTLIDRPTSRDSHHPTGYGI